MEISYEVVSAGAWIDVGEAAKLCKSGGRLQVEVDGRFLAVIQHGEKLYAMDATCYHMGGPLLMSDIEDHAGVDCVVCPWHRYPISLETGERVYQDLHGNSKSSGVKQRVHGVQIKGDRLMVKLDTNANKIESDSYAFKTPAPSQRGGAMPQRSGHLKKMGASAPQGLPRMGASQPGGASGGGAGQRVQRHGRRPAITPEARGSNAAIGQMVGKSMQGGDGHATWSTPEETRQQAQMKLLMAANASLAANKETSPSEEWVKKGTWRGFKVLAREFVAAGCVRLTLADPTGEVGRYLGNQGQHVEVAGSVEGTHTERPYTPIILPVQDRGTTPKWELIIKAYPDRPGALSPVLSSTPVGGEIHCKPGDYRSSVTLPERGLKEVAMLCGGTGITPMLQVIHGLLDAKRRGVGGAMPKVRLVYANRTAAEVIMAPQLAAMALEHPEVELRLVLTGEPVEGEVGADLGGVEVTRGKLEGETLAAVLPQPSPSTLTLVCGPPGFHQIVRAALDAAGHHPGAMHEFK